MTTQTEEPATTDDGETSDALAAYVRSRAASLQRGYAQDESAAVATLARMRRALPTSQQISPETWDALASMPESLMGQGDEPSRAEWAAVTALSLFARHVQSRRDQPMHVAGWKHSPGRACGRLASTAGPGAERRFRALTRAPGHVATLAHLRGLVAMLRSQGVPLDYGRLADDLRDYQHPDRMHAVRMRWIRDFHRPGFAPDDTDTTNADETVSEPSSTDPSGDQQ